MDRAVVPVIDNIGSSKEGIAENREGCCFQSDHEAKPNNESVRRGEGSHTIGLESPKVARICLWLLPDKVRIWDIDHFCTKRKVESALNLNKCTVD